MGFRDVTVTQCVVRVDDPAKSLRLLGNRTFLGWLLREFSRFGVTDFLLLTDQVPTHVQTFLPRQVRVALAAPPAGSGSGGALFHARDQLQDRFLLCDGDRLFDWNLANLLVDAAADEPGLIGRVMIRHPGVSGGMAVFHRKLVDHLGPICSLEADVLPDLTKRNLLRCTLTKRRLVVGGPSPAGVSTESPRCPVPVQEARAELEIGSTVGIRGAFQGRPGDEVAPLRRKALFFDRDGVLNLDHGYVGSLDRFEWMDGALDAIRHATQVGWHVFVVTNQSGVARGLYLEDAVRSLLDWMAERARAAGGTIDDVRFCPFHPEAVLDAYRQDHPWRKPLPGMLLDLIHAWELDPKHAVMIGDQATDIEAAAAAGVTGHLFPGGNLLHFVSPYIS
jgi:D,D-heptose 1,7-bisphosphate phosphatase